MKYLITLCLTIVMFGNGGYQDLVNKYSLFLGDTIRINIVKDFSIPNCGVKVAKGCTYFYNNGNKRIELSNNLNRNEFEYFLLHEIGHYYFGVSEEKAMWFSLNLIDYVNNLK